MKRNKMRNVFPVLIGLVISWPAYAQATTTYIDRDLVAIGVTILAGGFGLLFLLEVVKRLFDYQLKRKALELGLPEVPARDGQESRSILKWVAIWTGLGSGLTIVQFTLPLGIHSLAIMCFCLAASFLGYYLYLKQSSTRP